MSEFFTTQTLAWLGIAFCISQSAMFSGLNLAFFSLSRLQLEIEAEQGSEDARSILALRQDSNFLLTTILWGNVSINVILTLLSDSVLAGVFAFMFSTFFITIFGEILPQAYFSRNAMKMASILAPALKFYQTVFYIVAKPCAVLLDTWLGKEGIDYFRERELKTLIRAHIDSDDAELDKVEGQGALNFLAIDDIKVIEEGELVDESSIIRLPTKVDLPLIPEISHALDDPFLLKINASGHHWVVLADEQGEPRLILDADAALRGAVFERPENYDMYDYCRRPLVIYDTNQTIAEVIGYLRSQRKLDGPDDAAIDYDVVLIWTENPRIITGADILGKLLRGIIAQKVT